MINLTLLKKEMMGLRLGVGLILAILAIDLAYRCLLGFPDRPDPSSSDSSEEVLSIVFNSFLIGIVFGIALVGQEREHRTLVFLDGLPVTRLSIFMHKAVAALVMAVLMELFLEAYEWFFAYLERDSLSEPIETSQMMASFATRVLLNTCVLGGVAFLSFSRKWFPLLLGIVVSILVWIGMREGPLSIWLDTSALVQPNVVEGKIVWPLKQIVGHACLGVVGWLLAAFAFLHRDGRITQMMDRYSDLPIGGYITAVGYVLAGIVWFVLLSTWGARNGDDPDDRPVVERAAGDKGQPEGMLTDSPSGVDNFDGLETEYFQLVYRKSSEKVLNEVRYSLDPVHQQVLDFFQNPAPVSGRIVVDLGGLVPGHTAGVTNWTRVRVPLAKSRSKFDFLQTLRHEVGHVYINKLSDGKATAYFNALRVFHEGVATAVQFSTDDEETAAEILKMERWAAAVDARGRVPLFVLCDDALMKQTRDENIVYPLGYLVAQSLLDIGGPTMPRRMMETARGLNMPTGYRATQLWSTLLQNNCASLEMLSSAYEAKLDALQERESEFLKGIPRLSSKLAVESGEIVIRAEAAEGASESAEMVCAIEQQGVLTVETMFIPRAQDGSFRLPRDQIAASRLRYLVGWSTPEASFPVFEPWIEAKLAAN
jgi:ABC-type transport system involved in multi-copper enzyme maturation permease subunit